MICNKPLIHSKKWYVADTVEAWKSQKITLIRPVKFIVCTVQQSINGMEISLVFGAGELRVLFSLHYLNTDVLIQLETSFQ